MQIMQIIEYSDRHSIKQKKQDHHCPFLVKHWTVLCYFLVQSYVVLHIRILVIQMSMLVKKSHEKIRLFCVTVQFLIIIWNVESIVKFQKVIF